LVQIVHSIGFSAESFRLRVTVFCQAPHRARQRKSITRRYQMYNLPDAGMQERRRTFPVHVSQIPVMEPSGFFKVINQYHCSVKIHVYPMGCKSGPDFIKMAEQANPKLAQINPNRFVWHYSDKNETINTPALILIPCTKTSVFQENTHYGKFVYEVTASKYCKSRSNMWTEETDRYFVPLLVRLRVEENGLDYRPEYHRFEPFQLANEKVVVESITIGAPQTVPSIGGKDNSVDMAQTTKDDAIPTLVNFGVPKILANVTATAQFPLFLEKANPKEEEESETNVRPGCWAESVPVPEFPQAKFCIALAKQSRLVCEWVATQAVKVNAAILANASAGTVSMELPGNVDFSEEDQCTQIYQCFTWYYEQIGMTFKSQAIKKSGWSIQVNW
jgi:hypothetical protein